MLGHYLLTLYRSLSRHRLYAAINVRSLFAGPVDRTGRLRLSQPL